MIMMIIATITAMGRWTETEKKRFPTRYVGRSDRCCRGIIGGG
jgi:hypothetical protein